MRVGLGQLLADADPAVNLRQLEVLAARASEQGADVVVFPEATMRCFGRSLTEIAEPFDGPWATRVREVAAHHGLVIIAGMFTPADAGRVTNTLLITGPGVEARYDKIHLFDAYGFRESDTVAPGTEPVVSFIDGVGVGVATCYDLRFPGLFTALAERGAEVVLVPASWGSGPGKLDQWRLLVRARAADVTAYVVAVDQADPAASGVATRGSAPTGIGHSTVAGPTGDVVVELGATPEFAVVDLDLTRVAEARRTVPVLANRRF